MYSSCTFARLILAHFPKTNSCADNAIDRRLWKLIGPLVNSVPRDAERLAKRLGRAEKFDRFRLRHAAR